MKNVYNNFQDLQDDVPKYHVLSDQHVKTQKYSV